MGFRVLAPEAQDYLKARIALELPQSVPCDVGFPPGTLEADHVYVGGEWEAELQLPVSGGNQRDEASSIHVRCLATFSTAEYAEARDRALAYAGAVEDAVSDDPSLGGLVEFAWVSRVRCQEAIPSERSRSVGVTVTISYAQAVSRG